MVSIHCIVEFYTHTCIDFFDSVISCTPSISLLFHSKISSALELSEIRIIDFPVIVGVNLRDLDVGIEFPAYGELNSYALRPVPIVRPRTDRSNDLIQGIDAVMMTK